ncbi:hypothetical protein LPB140_08675 [Sphingorhabdus lutea]|uniref:Uncharacterized protein n=2 Tax=Sphingorhabdus lutea TaxID=1913578 RepID=A0A1L3JCK3_9SPHN|nr:hypothetical protein LPB140_08675 [Sphingorhabdus lutea]
MRSIKPINIFAAISLVIGLAACGGPDVSKDGDEVSIETEKGSMKVSETLKPEQMPFGFAVLPGATSKGVMSTKNEDGESQIVTLETDKSMEDTAEFYKKEAEAKGFKIESETSVDNGKMIIGKSDRGEDISFVISKETSDAATQILIMGGKNKK